MIILERPKYVQNLGAVIRACACFGEDKLIWTADRIRLEELERTPRELRMKEYRTVEILRSNRPFDLIPSSVTPVCVEIIPGAIPLPQFQHPKNAAYVFGPEDGDVCQVYRRLCHQFVYIPTKYCLNLAVAVNIVLYDRQFKQGVLDGSHY